MGRSLAVVVATGLVVVGLAAFRSIAGASETHAAPAAGGVSEATKASGPVSTAKKMTFLELGSVGCVPCEQMVPVLDAVRQRHGDRVDVVFYDVKRNPSVARQWRVVLIPTQVFLDVQGKEVFRHQGFFALGDVLNVLRKMGVD